MFIEMYLFLLFVPVSAGILLGLVRHDKVIHVSAILCGISCAAGILSYPFFLELGAVSYAFPIPSAWGPYSILIDQVSALMISFTSLVFLMIMMHMVRSGSSPKSPRYYGLLCALFLFCALAMCADSVLLILIAWEMVTLVSFLMSYNERGEDSRWKFFVIAHLGGLMVTAAFIAMYLSAGTEVLSAWSDLGSVMGLGMSCAAILLLFFGFGTKLGLVPFHAWMPDLYADAPTHTAALMSTVSANIAVLILFKAVFGFIGVTSDMYLLAIVMLVFASATTIWGALEALVQTEPKRILAYSSIENMGLVILCFSLGILFTSGTSTELVTIALVAGLLHTINHSFFKSLMLLTVNTVEDSTGTTEIEKMGGLAVALPLLSGFALVGVLSMAAIPPFNGFASEWLMIQSLLGGEVMGMQGMELILPIGVAVLGISGMMAAVSYARIYGFMFLGRPRSEAVAKPGKIHRTTMLPLAVLAASCLILGICIAPMLNHLADGVNEVMSVTPSDAYRDNLIETLNLPMLAGLLLAIVAALFALNRMSKKKTVKTETWDCGTTLEENMQYSSVGFTQPIVRVFHPLYGDTTEIVDDQEIKKKKYSVRFREPFVRYIYEPIGSAIMSASRFIGRMQNGNIQTYLGYILVTLVTLLLVVSII